VDSRNTNPARVGGWNAGYQEVRAAVFCARDVGMAFKLVLGLDAGGVMAKDSTDYGLDSMPFGGIKNSGLGREGIKFSLREMTGPKIMCRYLRKVFGGRRFNPHQATCRWQMVRSDPYSF
jgi:hypothetical protein